MQVLFVAAGSQVVPTCFYWTLFGEALGPCINPSATPTATPTPTPAPEPTPMGEPTPTPTPTPTTRPQPIVDLVAIDVDPTGNTATSLGPVDTCVAVEAGSPFTIDVIANSIPPYQPLAGGGLIGFQYDLNYGSLHVTAADNLQLIAANGVLPLEFTEEMPDNGGTLIVAFADLGTSEPESGAGIITRITLQAVSQGTTDLTLTDLVLVDSVSNSYLVSTAGSARIEVGGSCGP